MRKGLNPNKDSYHNEVYSHQIVIPVYIPFLSGYFEQSLEVLKMCLQSLFKTMGSGSFVTIVNNGSCKEVSEYLDDLLRKKIIQELVHSENIGKINSVLKGITGHNTPLLTIADSDVLFLSGWQKETYKVFNAFPKAGVVGLTPQFRSYENFCGNVIFDNCFSSRLKFDDVKNPLALQNFYESIGWDNSFNKDYLKKILVLKTDICTAIVGCGHYVATYRREVFKDYNVYSDVKLGINSEKHLDILPLKKNLWRLTTADNYAYHMGNISEKWMKEEIKNLRTINADSEITNPTVKNSSFRFFLKSKIFGKLFSVKMVKNLFYIYKGLPKEMRWKYDEMSPVQEKAPK